VERVPSRLSAAILGLLAVLAASALGASSAGGADRVYWANFATDKISYANLDGSGGVVDLNTGTATVKEPSGVAIDPVAGRVYWANHTGGKISWANLDGSGGEDLKTGAATVSGPEGVAIDVAARRIYWANEGAPKISWANLDGSGGEDLKTGAAMIGTAGGIAVYPAGGRVYWTNFGVFNGWISYANLDGSGGATLSIPSEYMDTPLGVAVDAAAGRLYWALDNPGKIAYAGLDGSSPAILDVRGLNIAGPYGVAIDPADGKVYVGSTQGNAVAFARLDGTGGAYLPFSPPKNSGVNFPALLETPRGTAAPEISRRPEVPPPRARRMRPRHMGEGRSVGSASLACGQGAWAADLVESFLYRAPLSFSYRWTRDGVDLPGGDAATFQASGVGLYRCRVTATNRAGSTAQTSAAIALFEIGGKAKLNLRKGTGLLPVVVPGRGTISLAGKGVVARTVEASANAKVLVKAKGKALKKLKRKKKVTVNAGLTFTPAEGLPSSQSTAITLRLRRPRR
jgi:DNA-binding beta-propeller fold protein YncE